MVGYGYNCDCIITGCTDSEACNYDENANTLIYSECDYDSCQPPNLFFQNILQLITIPHM